MRLSEVLNDSSIVVRSGQSEGDDKWSIIDELTDLLVSSGQAESVWRESIREALVDRERQSSTGMQDGFAIPHCRMEEPIESTLVSLAVLKEGMDFDAIDDQPTHLVVCLVTPRRQNREHLRILAGIAQLFAGADFRAALLLAETPGQVVEVVRAEEGRLGQ